VPARVTPAIDDLPTFNTLSPRVGVAYDLRGNGKTAIKAAWGRYAAQEAASWPSQFNRLALTSEVRTWIDGNGDDIAQDAEIGPPINPNFGLPSDPRNVDPDIKRPHNHSFNLNVDHEVMPRVALSGGYYYRIYRNDRITDDLNTRPEDWLSAPITNAQTGLTSTVFYLPIAMRGQPVNSIIRNSDNWRNYHGFDLNMTARFREGAVVLTGIQLGKNTKYSCDQENLNGANHFLSASTSVGGPWCDQTQLPNDRPFDKTFKLSAIYPLPLNIQVSGVFQSNPGVSRILTGTVPAVTLPTPGYFPGSAVAFVPFVPEGVEWTERINQVDLKFNGRIDAAKMRIDPELAIYNVFNADPVLYYNDIIGPTLGAYQKIMQGRLIRFGVRIAY
jgi:hypothetical protein